MQLDYSNIYKEINELLLLDSTQRKTQYISWMDTNTPENIEKCFQLAVRLRKNRNPIEANEISKYLTEKNPSLKSYNMYLVTTYDLYSAEKTSISVLSEVFIAAWDFYKPLEFEANITATLLKCCNLFTERSEPYGDLFFEIYNKVPVEENNNNSFIIVQYCRRLIAENKTQDVFNYLDQLPAELANNRALQQLKKTCGQNSLSKMQLITTKFEPKRAQRIALISEGVYLSKLTGILKSFSIDMSVTDILSENLIETLNQNTYKATMAILVIPAQQLPHDIALANWAFTFGYSVHKFSKNNMALFVHDDDYLQTSLLNSFFTMFGANKYNDDLDLITKLGEIGIISG